MIGRTATDLECGREPEAWRAAMAPHTWVTSRLTPVPLAATPFGLQAAIHGLLDSTGWKCMGWHAWR